MQQLEDSWKIRGETLCELINACDELDSRTAVIPVNADDIEVLNYSDIVDEYVVVHLITRENIEKVNKGYLRGYKILKDKIENTFYKTRTALRFVPYDLNPIIVSVPEYAYENISRGKGLSLMAPGLARNIHLANMLYKEKELRLVIRSNETMHKLFYAGKKNYVRPPVAELPVQIARVLQGNIDLKVKKWQLSNSMLEINLEYEEWGRKLCDMGIPIIPGLSFFSSDIGACKYTALASIRVEGEKEPLFFPCPIKHSYSKYEELRGFIINSLELKDFLQSEIELIKLFNRPIKKSIFTKMMAPFVNSDYGVKQIERYVRREKENKCETYLEELLKVLKCATSKDVKIYPGKSLKHTILGNLNVFTKMLLDNT